MAGNLNALGLIAIMAVTIWAVLRYGHVPSINEAIEGVQQSLKWFLVLSLTVCCTIFYREYMPLIQFFLPICCITVVHLTITGQPARRRALIFLCIAYLMLFGQYIVFLHTTNYTSNPLLVNYDTVTMQDSVIHGIQWDLDTAMDMTPSLSDKTFPAGPIGNSGVWKLIIAELQKHYNPTMTMYTTYPLWHTWLTGMSGKHAHIVRLWYPGGKLKDGVSGLAYRR